MISVRTISYWAARDSQGNNPLVFSETLGRNREEFTNAMRQLTDMTLPQIWALMDTMECNKEYPVTWVDGYRYCSPNLYDMGFDVGHTEIAPPSVPEGIASRSNMAQYRA